MSWIRVGGTVALEIYVDTPPSVCEQREPDLYRRVRNGELGNVSGIGADYEAPESPDITVDGAVGTIEEIAERIVAELYGDGLLPPEKQLGAGI